jgi:dihydrofolate reductase
LIRIIAAIGNNNEIGLNNKLLWHIPEEMKVFIEHTRGKTVLMGRKTFESIGKPLPNRTNLVVSRTVNTIAGTIVYSNVADAVAEHPDLVIIGGTQIYKECIAIAQELIISHIPLSFPEADSYFPEFEHLFTRTETLCDTSPYFKTYKYTKNMEKNNGIQVQST